MAENGPLGVCKYLLDVVLGQDFLLKEAFQGIHENYETVLRGLCKFSGSLRVEKVKGFPQALHEVTARIRLFDLEVAADEDEVADDEVRDPLELVGFETVLIFVPGAPVLSCLFTDIFDVLKDQPLCELIGIGSIPEGLDMLGLQQIQVECSGAF